MQHYLTRAGPRKVQPRDCEISWPQAIYLADGFSQGPGRLVSWLRVFLKLGHPTNFRDVLVPEVRRLLWRALGAFRTFEAPGPPQGPWRVLEAPGGAVRGVKGSILRTL